MYAVYVNGAMHLTKKVNIQAATTTSIDLTNWILNPGEMLIAGDIVDDNTVNALDYTAFSSSFGKTVEGIDPTSMVYKSDLNGDGVVDILDYTIFSTSYGLAGDN